MNVQGGVVVSMALVRIFTSEAVMYDLVAWRVPYCAGFKAAKPQSGQLRNRSNWPNVKHLRWVWIRVGRLRCIRMPPSRKTVTCFLMAAEVGAVLDTFMAPKHVLATGRVIDGSIDRSA